MRTKTMEHLVQELKKAGMSESETGPIEGCSPDQIADLEVPFGARLPKTYKEFLSVMEKIRLNSCPIASCAYLRLLSIDCRPVNLA